MGVAIAHNIFLKNGQSYPPRQSIPILRYLINWSEVKILKMEHDSSKRLFTERWYVNEKPQVLNRNDGLSFLAVNRKLLNSQS